MTALQAFLFGTFSSSFSWIPFLLSCPFFTSSLDLALELREDGLTTEGDLSTSEELPLEDLSFKDDLSLEDELSLEDDLSLEDVLSFEEDL